MSNNVRKTRDYSKTTPRQTANWVSIDYPETKFRSRLPEMADKRNVAFFIDKAQIVEKDKFKTKDGKQIPAHKAIRFTGSFVDENAQEQVILIEFPLTDRFRTCNTLLNKIAFAIGDADYDGFVSLGLSATKDDKRRLWVDTFGDNQKRDSDGRDAYPFDPNIRRFVGVPEMVPVLDGKGKHMEKDGMKLYDTAEFDAFWLDVAEKICAFFDEAGDQ